MILSVFITVISDHDKPQPPGCLLERTYSGIARARDAGKRFGRPPVLNEEQTQKVLERIKSGASISAIAREFRTTRQTILRVRAKQQTVTV